MEFRLQIIFQLVKHSRSKKNSFFKLELSINHTKASLVRPTFIMIKTSLFL